MKIAIVGAGAVGLYYGVRLAKSGANVSFLLRSDFEVARKYGIAIRSQGRAIRLAPEEMNAERSSECIGSCDLVIVALKATSNSALSDLLRPLVGPATGLLTLQNGLGNDDCLAELYPKNPILSGLCFVCLNRLAPAVVENYLPGSVSLGERGREASNFAREVAQLFRVAGVETCLSDQLRLIQWKKLVWNIPFNGLAIASGGQATDAILADPHLKALTRELMAEIIVGAGALGLEIEESLIDTQIEMTLRMGAYKPSSLIDFQARKPVEIEALWGEPYRQASEAGAEVPRLGMLYRLLSALCGETSDVSSSGREIH